MASSRAITASPSWWRRLRERIDPSKRTIVPVFENVHRTTSISFAGEAPQSFKSTSKHVRPQLALSVMGTPSVMSTTVDTPLCTRTSMPLASTPPVFPYSPDVMPAVSPTLTIIRAIR